MNKDLLFAKTAIYDKCGFTCFNFKEENESKEYDAYTFTINEKKIKYRKAKITPTKIGQFVTIWKRKESGQIEPFDIKDEIDFVIISTRKEGYFGQFIFPAEVLLNKGIISGNNKRGKLGIRVYPPWDITTNKQAQKTQQWQSPFFIKIHNDTTCDLNLVKKIWTKDFT